MDPEIAKFLLDCLASKAARTKNPKVREACENWKVVIKNNSSKKLRS